MQDEIKLRYALCVTQGGPLLSCLCPHAHAAFIRHLSVAQADLRSEAFTDINVNLVGAAAAAAAAAMGAPAGGRAGSGGSSAPAAALTAAAAAAVGPVVSASAAVPKKPAVAANPSALPSVAAAAPPNGATAAAAAGGAEGEWDEGQEAALVEAMKQCGKELSDRCEWDGTMPSGSRVVAAGSHTLGQGGHTSGQGDHTWAGPVAVRIRVCCQVCSPPGLASAFGQRATICGVQ